VVTAPLSAPEIKAPAHWQRLDFISDLHLTAATPRTFAAWRDYLLGTAADAVFILGDLFEAWVGDDSRLEATSFEAQCAEVLRQASQRRPVHFMAGNRDFLLGADMLTACGVTGLADPTVLAAFNQRTLLVHGDAWCLADAPYQQFRTQVRNPAWQAEVLQKPLAWRRSVASSMRSESERQMAEQTGPVVDVDFTTAQQWLESTTCTTLVHGHTHRPTTQTLPGGAIRHVLSDWSLDAPGVDRCEVLCWQADGWQRLNLASSQD
jgi:UDP-2,3-diacylglucosamine hydrolase